jgi:phosphoribosylformimino-5-aminoimidazole carboxamide ribotide isomerase
MILYPAIDLKDGACVRLQRGEMNAATIFNINPADQAREFQNLGFPALHVVDLNGAFAGRSVNGEAVDAILSAVSMPVQLGGGIRSMDDVRGWLERGISRVILGTAAVKNPALVREAAAAFPGQIAVGIDARDGRVAVEGWAETSDMLALDLARCFEDTGVAAIIYTDVSRDGMLTGLNLDATAALASAVSIPVIASGGLAGLADVEALLLPENAHIAGAIAGRAFYDGRLDAKAALSMIEAKLAQPGNQV